jgi:hypothetical protein
MVHNAAARYELIGRYYSGVVSRLCIRWLHAVITVLFHARLNTQIKCLLNQSINFAMMPVSKIFKQAVGIWKMGFLSG